MSLASRDGAVLTLLALLPLIAHAPAWAEGRLLGPGDGAALHLPLKAAVWEAYRAGELPSWNPTIFLGTPLLASYRPGAFYPPVAALWWLPPFDAFQVLVLVSLSASGVLLYLYLRRLGAHRVGAYFAGLSFPLGPYLVGHLGDTATVVAAPALILVLLAAEAWVSRPDPVRVAALAASLALLLLAGSPEAARAGAALLAGRLLIALLTSPAPRKALARSAVGAVAAGVLLAAPQLVPTLLAAHEAGRPVTGLAEAQDSVLPGVTGLVLRYASHTPALSLALAALPLAATQTPVRVLGAGLGIALALQWGRGPLSAPGALPLAFDLTLCILAGLSLSAQWRARREPLGARLRAYFLFASLASAAALSVAAAALGPLPQVLAGAVGVLALALILYFTLAASADPLRAAVWLLPLTASFLLQPHGRRTWEGAPTRQNLWRGTGTREAIDRAMGPRRHERSLALVEQWPRDQAEDLAYGSLAALAGRRSANGYDPMVPLRTRQALGGMGVGGTLPATFLRTHPGRLEVLGIRWVQVPHVALLADTRTGHPPPLRAEVEQGRPRFFPVPITPATELRLVSWLAEAAEAPQGEPVALVEVRLASGRGFSLPARAGLEKLALPGRYYVDGVRVERLPGRGRFLLAGLTLFDAASGRLTPVSAASAYVSDGGHFREAAATPYLRLFELPGSLGSRVVEQVRVLPTEQDVLQALHLPADLGFDPRRQALLSAGEAGKVTLPPGSRSSRADTARASGGRLEVRAEGPGLLVVADAWDPGWSALLDGEPAPVVRVNHVQMGVALRPGVHRVTLRYRPPGFAAGMAMAALGAAGLGLAAWRGRV